jgi:FkbM family methyltransferase
MESLRNENPSSRLFEGPVTLVDIGAKGGIPTRWKGIESVDILGFEPNQKSYRRLSEAEKQSVLNYAVWDEVGTTELYVTRNAGLSSLRKPNRNLVEQFPDADRFDITDTETVETTTFDTAIDSSAFRFSDIDFIKLDTQGTEYDILRQGKNVISGPLVGVQVEVAFAPIYNGQALFHEIDHMLRNHDFQLVDLKRIFWKRTGGLDLGGKKGQLIPGDALYFQDPDRFLTSVADCDVDTAAKIRRYVTICCMYGYFDIALSFLETAHTRGFIDDPFFETWQSLIRDAGHRSGIRTRLPSLIQRGLSKLGITYFPAYRSETGRLIDPEPGNE